MRSVKLTKSKLKLLALALVLVTALLTATNQAHAQTLTLSRYSGQPATVVTLSGSGYKPNQQGIYPLTTAYAYCLSQSSSIVSCVGNRPSMLTTASGAISPGTILTIPATLPGTYYVIVVGWNGNNIVVASVAFTVVSLTVYPSSGNPGSVVSVTGSGYTSSTAYGYCLSTSGDSVSCVSGAGAAFTSAVGGIPGGTALTVPRGTPSGRYYVIIYHDSTVIATSPFTVATLSLSSSSGQPGTLVTLTGSGYASPSSNGGLSFCLSTSNSTASCVVGSSTSLTPTSSGSIPAGTTLTIPPSFPGSYYVIIYQGSTIMASTPFTVSGITQVLPSPTSPLSPIYVFAGVAAILFCGLGVVIGVRSYTGKREKTRQERLLGLVQGLGKISLEELRTKLGLTVSQTEDLVVRMIGTGKLSAKVESGYVVLEHVGTEKVDVEQTTITRSVYEVKCSHCGARNTTISQNCTRCGAPLEK